MNDKKKTTVTNENGEKRNPPHTIKIGRVMAKVWQNETKDGKPIQAVDIHRSYKKDDKWVESHRFYKEDLVIFKTLLAEVETYLESLA